MPSAPTPAVPGHSLHQHLGSGTAGVVYSATPSHTPKARPSLAVKLIPSAKVRAAVRREVALHILLSHPNIVNLHKVSPALHPSASSPPALALVTDLAPHGDMFAEVATSGPLQPRLLRRRLRDIVAALTYLHHNKILHLDLKLENVVLSSSRSAKLIDFGCARHVADPDRDTPVGGTLHYLPPEALRDPKKRPTTAYDAWSLGVLAYTAIAGCYPFNGDVAGASDEENDRATRRRILHAHPHRLPSYVSLPSDLRRIIYGLLEKDPAKRMTIHQVTQQLSMSLDTASIDASAVSLKDPKPAVHTNCDNTRPTSPSSPLDADFAPCNCGAKQSQDDALRVVDAIRRSRVRAANDARRYSSDKDTVKASRRRSTVAVSSN